MAEWHLVSKTVFLPTFQEHFNGILYLFLSIEKLDEQMLIVLMTGSVSYNTLGIGIGFTVNAAFPSRSIALNP